MHALWPWGAAEYPGIKRGLASTFVNRAAWQSIVNWQVGRRRMPAWAWSLLLNALERRRAEIDHAIEIAKKEAGD